jgi:hypothetical protein
MESMHMDPNNYAKPETFGPARFLDNTKSMMTAANGKLENQDHYSFGWERYLYFQKAVKIIKINVISTLKGEFFWVSSMLLRLQKYTNS